MTAEEIGRSLPALATETVPSPPPIPEQIRLEAGVAAGDEEATREIEARGEPTNLNCPECGGPLNREPGRVLRFRCRLGHAYAAASLGEASRRTLESSLWAAIRLLEQRANLDRARCSEEHARGRAAAATLYRERAAEVAGHVHVLREMLSKLPIDG
jgi:two-component system chemotaxis response regulator CheB